jgi:CheY-like chemotaxis protein
LRPRKKKKFITVARRNGLSARMGDTRPSLSGRPGEVNRPWRIVTGLAHAEEGPLATILVIDDEPGTLEFLDAVLSVEGHRVVTATDGRVGLRLVREVRPDLVITDILMPELDGLEVLLEVRRGSRVPVIAISGGGAYQALDHLETARLFGAASILPKPFGSAEILAAVRAALGTEPRPPG